MSDVRSDAEEIERANSPEFIRDRLLEIQLFVVNALSSVENEMAMERSFASESLKEGK
jgi:hypothetical protein